MVFFFYFIFLMPLLHAGSRVTFQHKVRSFHNFVLNPTVTFNHTYNKYKVLAMVEDPFSLCWLSPATLVFLLFLNSVGMLLAQGLCTCCLFFWNIYYSALLMPWSFKSNFTSLKNTLLTIAFKTAPLASFIAHSFVLSSFGSKMYKYLMNIFNSI